MRRELNKMIRFLFSSLLILSLVTPYTLRLCLITNYQLNIDQITEQFCVNKDKPKMHCNGKCHLMKKLSNYGQNVTKSTIPYKRNTNHLRNMELIFCQLNQFISYKTYFHSIKNKPTTLFFGNLCKGFSIPLFSPPQSIF